MKTPEQERLLQDVLHDEGYLAYRAELRARMLAEVRRHRRSRHTTQFLALAACIAFALGLHWLVQHRVASTGPVVRVIVVRSVPLKADQIVTTAAHRPNLAVVQLRNVKSGAPQFDLVRTVGELPLGTLSDEQLLEAFKDRPVALVHSATGKKLFFLDEAPLEFVNP